MCHSEKHNIITSKYKELSHHPHTTKGMFLKKAKSLGDDLFNLETTAALLFKNYRLRSLKLSSGLSVNNLARMSLVLLDQFTMASFSPDEFCCVMGKAAVSLNAAKQLIHKYLPAG